MSGPDRLRAQLDVVREALRGFADPLTDELAGLALMRDALAEREAHIASTLDDIETTSLRVAFDAEPPPDAGAVGRVLTAIHGAVHGAAADLAGEAGADAVRVAVSLRLVEGSGERLVLQRRRGPVDAQPRVAGGEALLVDAALDAVLDALGADGGRPASGEELAAALAACGAAVTLRLHRTEADEDRTVHLDQAALQALA